jgi:hypothetical protein
MAPVRSQTARTVLRPFASGATLPGSTKTGQEPQPRVMAGWNL